MFISKRTAMMGLSLAVGLLLTAGVVSARRLRAGDEPPPDKGAGRLRDTILVLDQQFWEVASRHDVETLGRLFADDYIGLGHDGARWTKPALLEQHRAVRLGDLERTSAEVIRVGEDAVLLTYDAKFKVYTKDGVPWDATHQRLTSCWIRRDGGWFVAFSQATNLGGPVPPSLPPRDGAVGQQPAEE